MANKTRHTLVNGHLRLAITQGTLSTVPSGERTLPLAVGADVDPHSEYCDPVDTVPFHMGRSGCISAYQARLRQPWLRTRIHPPVSRRLPCQPNLIFKSPKDSLHHRPS